MKIIDISVPLSEDFVAYKNMDRNKFKRIWNKREGDFTRNSNISMNSHTGTHIDAPSHFLRFGKGIDKTELNNLIGECQVIDLAFVKKKIAYIHLKDKIVSERVLLKTSNTYGKDFDKRFVYLDVSGAEYLVKCGVKVVGIDYLGIERESPNHETHRALLKKKISIIEGLDLSKVMQGKYYMIALPLSIKGGEAAPARVILTEKPL